MYWQRLEGLKAGRTYTLLPPDSFQAVWEKAIGQPTYQDWKTLLTREANALAYGQGSNRLAILLGDSITMWFPSELLPQGRLWLNQGISGDNTNGILKRLSAFSITRPHAIYILAGINDLRQGKSDTLVIHNLYQIIRELRYQHPTAQVVLQSILPTRLPSLPNTRISGINRELAAIAKQQNATFLDLNSSFTNSDNILRRDCTTDGLHLSRRGYEVWQKALHQAESRLLLNRDRRYQQWLQQTPTFTLSGREYRWIPYRVRPGDTLEDLARKTLGSGEVHYYDLIALRNNINGELIESDRTIYIPQISST
jgi:lysophospholipase L1-like esterase